MSALPDFEGVVSGTGSPLRTPVVPPTTEDVKRCVRDDPSRVGFSRNAQGRCDRLVSGAPLPVPFGDAGPDADAGARGASS